jgi:hypothetical protein
MIMLMPLIIMKDENPPKDNHCKEKLMCHPIKCQQGEIEKKITGRPMQS